MQVAALVSLFWYGTCCLNEALCTCYKKNMMIGQLSYHLPLWLIMLGRQVV